MQRLSNAVDRGLGLPVRGRHVGGGRHAPISATPGIGWRLHHQRVYRHPSRDLYSYPVDSDVQRLDGNVIDVSGDLVTVDTSTAVTRDSTWDQAVVTAR